jgi:hypothetical protein
MYRGWISLFGPVDVSKFKENFLIPNKFEISSPPNYSNFSNFEGKKEIIICINGKKRNGSIHILVSPVGYCIIFLIIKVSYDELLNKDNLKFDIDNYGQSLSTVNFFFKISEDLFQVPSIILLQFKSLIKDSTIENRMKFLGITPKYNHLTISWKDMVYCEDQITEEQWLQLKNAFMSINKDTRSITNLKVPENSFKEFDCYAFYSDCLFLKGPKTVLYELIKAEFDISRNATTLSYVANEFIILENLISDLQNYLESEQVSWLYVKHELNKITNYFRTLVLKFERSSYDQIIPSNVRISIDEPYYNYFEKINYLETYRRDYKSKKERIELLITDLRKELELKIDQEENLASTRLVQLFSFLATLEVIFGIINIVNPKQSDIPIWGFGTLILVFSTLFLVFFGSRYQINKKEKQAEKIEKIKKFSEQIKNIDLMKNELNKLLSIQAISKDFLDKEFQSIDQTKVFLTSELKKIQNRQF